MEHDGQTMTWKEYCESDIPFTSSIYTQAYNWNSCAISERIKGTKHNIETQLPIEYLTRHARNAGCLFGVLIGQQNKKDALKLLLKIQSYKQIIKKNDFGIIQIG